MAAIAVNDKPAELQKATRTARVERPDKRTMRHMELIGALWSVGIPGWTMGIDAVNGASELGSLGPSLFARPGLTVRL
jgi:hypothetical protein